MRDDKSTETRSLYDSLEDRILARDQVGASEAYYGLVRSGRPLPEIVGEAVRIHAPLTHVPYHERIDQGFVNFVNNDHCLLSRARHDASRAVLLPKRLAGLPMAQTVWYIPTGLDIWNQKINKAPGHYARGGKPLDGPPVKPVVHWPDQEPEHIEGSIDDKLDHWLDLVHRGHVLEAYRVFLGIMDEPAHRKEALGAARLCRAHRPAGPRLPQSLLHHRPQVVPRPRHGRARQFRRLGQCPSRALCGCARHRRRPALVLDLRDGLQLHHPLHREAEDIGHPLWRQHSERRPRSCATRRRCRRTRRRRSSTSYSIDTSRSIKKP